MLRNLIDAMIELVPKTEKEEAHKDANYSLTSKDVARLVGCSIVSADERMHTGIIPSVNISSGGIGEYRTTKRYVKNYIYKGIYGNKPQTPQAP